MIYNMQSTYRGKIALSFSDLPIVGFRCNFGSEKIFDIISSNDVSFKLCHQRFSSFEKNNELLPYFLSFVISIQSKILRDMLSILKLRKPLICLTTEYTTSANRH